MSIRKSIEAHSACLSHGEGGLVVKDGLETCGKGGLVVKAGLETCGRDGLAVKMVLWYR